MHRKSWGPVLCIVRMLTVYECQAQMDVDGNDSKREIAHSHENPTRNLNEDFEVWFCAWITSGLTLLSDRRPQRPILLMVIIGLWGCFCSVTALPNPNLVASFTNV